MLQTLFYVSHNGEEIGPLSIEDIHDHLKEQKLLDEDFIYVEEREDWIPLRTYLAEEQDNKTPPSGPIEERRQSTSTVSGISLLPDELHISEPHSESQPIPILPQELQGTAQSPSPASQSAGASPSFDQLAKPTDSFPPPAVSSSPQDVEPDEITQDTKRIPQEFTLREGTTELMLESLRPGRIEVVVALEDDSAKHREELKVIGGEPHEIKIQVSPSYKAGDEKPLTIEVIDEFGEPCSDFKGSLSLQLNQESTILVPLHGPKTTHSLECCKAGEHVLKIKNVSPALKHPSDFKFRVSPGEPTTLKIHSEGTPRAGQPHCVKIQAFDAFGNLATTYDGPLKVEVLEHPNIARSSQEPALRILPASKTGA